MSGYSTGVCVWRGGGGSLQFKTVATKILKTVTQVSGYVIGISVYVCKSFHIAIDF